MSMKQFYTLENANRLEKLKLELPNGEPSDYYLMIRGSDSEEFRVAKMDSHRRMAKFDGEKAVGNEQNLFLIECETRCVAALIGEWNFEEELTPSLAYEFLKNSPEIERLINVLSVRKPLPPKKKKASSTGPKKK